MSKLFDQGYERLCGGHMGSGTGIEWTEVTWNPTTGCDRISAGCDHCYALALAKRLKAMGADKYQACSTSNGGGRLAEHCPDGRRVLPGSGVLEVLAGPCLGQAASTVPTRRFPRPRSRQERAGRGRKQIGRASCRERG